MNPCPSWWKLLSLYALCSFSLAVALPLEAEPPLSPDIALIQAIGKKDPEAIKGALKNGANPNSRDGRPGDRGQYTPLARAIEAGNLECLKLLLEAGAEVRLIPGEKPWTHPLAMAQVFDRDPAIFELISNYCKELPEADVVTDYLLRPSVQKNNTAHIAWLRSKGADFAHVSEQGGCSPLSALEGGHVGLAKELLAQNEALLQQSPQKTLDPHEALEAATRRPHLESDIAAVLKRLHEIGFVFKERDRWNTLFAERAAGYRMPSMARVLGMTDEAKLSAIQPLTAEEIIHRAAGYGTNEEFSTLFEHYTRAATEEARRQMATAALISLIEFSEWRGARWSARLEQLLSLGADINGAAMGRNKSEVTPLQAATFADTEVIDQLLAHKADLNKVCSVNKCTALQWAVIFQSRNIQYLLDKGAKLTDFETCSLLRLVILNKRGDSRLILEILLTAGADPYSKPGGSKSAVETAAEMRDIALLRLLDSKHQQKSLLAEFTPPTDSPFIGVWSNEQGEFATVGLVLNEEGLGILGMAVMSAGWLPWKITNPTHAQMEIREGKETAILHMTLNDDGTLGLSIGEKPTAILKRQKQKAPTMREMDKALHHQ